MNKYRFSNLIKNVLRLYHNSSRSCTNTTLQPEQYYGFTYYRRPNTQDPPYNPSKLFLVRRIKHRGITKKEWETLEKLNIDGNSRYKGHVGIVKNIPEVNAMLWEVKHLVEIKPIFWKGDLPNDHKGTFLKNSGELIISPELKASEEVLDKTQAFIEKREIPTKYEVKVLLRKKWENPYFVDL